MTRSNPKSFGARLRATRELKKMNQMELASRSGLTPAAISQLESDDREPAFKTLKRLAAALETSMSFLLGEHESAVPPEIRDFFQRLEELESQDLDKVRHYTDYLLFQAKDKSTKVDK